MSVTKCYYRHEICTYVLDVEAKTVKVSGEFGEETVAMEYFFENSVILPALEEKEPEPPPVAPEPPAQP